jgi:hypothetical protein
MTVLLLLMITGDCLFAVFVGKVIALGDHAPQCTQGPRRTTVIAARTPVRTASPTSGGPGRVPRSSLPRIARGSRRLPSETTRSR